MPNRVHERAFPRQGHWDERYQAQWQVQVFHWTLLGLLVPQCLPREIEVWAQIWRSRWLQYQNCPESYFPKWNKMKQLKCLIIKTFKENNLVFWEIRCCFGLSKARPLSVNLISFDWLILFFRQLCSGIGQCFDCSSVSPEVVYR
mgnify:CR=1 FL=1